MPIGDGKFLTLPTNDPRLVAYASSAQPAWLWSTDGSRILWCNGSGAAALGIIDSRRLERPFTDAHRRQIAQLSRRLGTQATPRIERLRGFGSRLGQLATCACLRVVTTNGEAALLVARLDMLAGAAAQPPLPPSLVPSSTGAGAQTANDVAANPQPSQPKAPAASIAPACSAETPSGRTDIAGGNAGLAEAAAQIVDQPADEVTVDAPAAVAARRPLRFVWQIDADGRFALASDDFLAVAGERTAALQGRPWHEAANTLDLDSHGHISQAMALGETFSSLGVAWPLKDDTRGRVDLSGMPLFDEARSVAGYRGFGIYRWETLPAERAPADATPIDTGSPDEPSHSAPSDAEPFHAGPADTMALDPTLPDTLPPGAMPSGSAEADKAGAQDAPDPSIQETSAAIEAAPIAPDGPPRAETEIVEHPQNVVPFPLVNEPRAPSLSAVENRAFNEIARRLTQRFDELNAQRLANAAQARSDAADPQGPAQGQEDKPAEPASQPAPAWLAPAAAPARGESDRERMLLDLVPSGILIYRLDRLLYANRAFLGRTGYDSLHALQEAGGLDALYVEAGTGAAGTASDDGVPLTIAHSAEDRAPTDARLHSILWDGDPAHALILQDARTPTVAAPLAVAAPSAPPSPPPPAPGPQTAAPYEAILETATDGIVLYDRSGAILSSNRSAQMLFDMSANELRARNFADLFAADSQRVVLDYFESIDGAFEAGPRDHGREVMGRTRTGAPVPLSMTMGRSDDGGFFAVFRDLSQAKKSETELLQARRQAERAAATKADALARISRDVREPLNTILGLANIMLEQRSGAPSDERYAEHLRDIRAAGERAIAVLDDVISISSVESGQVPLKLVGQNLNEMVEQCVGVLQPQANRERVIIRTSLARALPQVLADTQSLRQIMMNIVTSSIRCSKAGGQVIVSTAAGDNGGAVLRVRDTGRQLSEAELASATGSPERSTLQRGAIDLSLARALAEANRAQLQVRTSETSGTLIEVAFVTRALAG